MAQIHRAALFVVHPRSIFPAPHPVVIPHPCPCHLQPLPFGAPNTVRVAFNLGPILFHVFFSTHSNNSPRARILDYWNNWTRSLTSRRPPLDKLHRKQVSFRRPSVHFADKHEQTIIDPSNCPPDASSKSRLGRFV